MKEMLVDQQRPILPSQNEEQSIKKRSNPDESSSIMTKKIKRALDVSAHWKNIYSIHRTTVTKVFPCQSKHDCKIVRLILYLSRLTKGEL